MSLSIIRATADQANTITHLINEAFWPSHQVFLDETNPASKLRVKEDLISSAVKDEEKELYVLVDSVQKVIFGTIMLIKSESETAKFNLLAKNPLFPRLKVGDLLIDHVIKRARELGKTILKIDVVDIRDAQNRLIDFYQAYGFTLTGNIYEFPRKHCLKPSFQDRVRLVELQKSIG